MTTNKNVRRTDHPARRDVGSAPGSGRSATPPPGAAAHHRPRVDGWLWFAVALIFGGLVVSCHTDPVSSLFCAEAFCEVEP